MSKWIDGVCSCCAGPAPCLEGMNPMGPGASYVRCPACRALCDNRRLHCKVKREVVA